MMKERLRPQYTIDQVKLHDSADDLWMIIYNKVYDVTHFAKDHPGGVEVLHDCGGVDGSAAFDDVGHSDDAVSMLTPYLIGELVPEQCVSYTNCRAPSVPVLLQKSVFHVNGKKCSALFEKLIILSLIVLAMLAIVIYIAIQKIKWSGFS